MEQFDPNTHEYIEEFDSAYSGIYRVNEDTGVEPAPTADPNATQEPEPAPEPKNGAGKLLLYFLIALAEAALVAGIVIAAKKKKN